MFLNISEVEKFVLIQTAVELPYCSISLPRSYMFQKFDVINACSFAEAIRVPVGWGALDKLVQWFYSGELPRIAPDCRWKNMSSEEQLSHLKPYAELSSLAEFWFLEGVKEESLAAVASCLNSSTSASLEFIGFAANLGQWGLVEAAIGSVAHLYPRLRDSGRLERLDEDVLNMLRAEYVRYSQHRGGSY